MADIPESAMIFLVQPLCGPLLNNEVIARAVGALILKRLHGEAELARKQPLRAVDQDKEWLVAGEADDGPSIRLRKTDCRVKFPVIATIAEPFAAARNSEDARFGPLIDGEEMARSFATVILTRLCGEAELEKQSPLRATDEGEMWRVQGSHQIPDQLPGGGSWYIQIHKADYRVEGFRHIQRLPIPDEVKPFIEEARNRK